MYGEILKSHFYKKIEMALSKYCVFQGLINFPLGFFGNLSIIFLEYQIAPIHILPTS